jgi:hypothetical protein
MLDTADAEKMGKIFTCIFNGWICRLNAVPDI